MPNVKLFIDDRHGVGQRDALIALLPDLRAQLCVALAVEPAACQLAVIAVAGLADQPQINAELHLMPRAIRLSELLRDLAQTLRRCVQAATGLSVAVRIAAQEPASYIALK